MLKEIKKNIINDIARDLEVSLAMDFEDIRSKVNAGEPYVHEEQSQVFNYKVTYHITIQRE